MSWKQPKIPLRVPKRLDYALTQAGIGVAGILCGLFVLILAPATLIYPDLFERHMKDRSF